MKRRYSHHALGALITASVLAVATLPAWAGTAGATTTATTGPSQAQITATKSQITQIEATIAQEQAKSATLSQEYDTAVATTQAIQAAIVVTDAKLAKTKAAITTDRHILGKAAVQAYMLGLTSSGVAPIFSSGSGTATARSEYEQTASGSLNNAKAALESQQSKLAATEAQQHAEEQQAQAAVAQVQTLQQQNASAQAAAQQTLQSVQGTLATQVAEAEQAQAAKAAKAAAAAALAQQQAAAAAAAAQAAEAAQVAAELGTQKATTSADQAAGSANPTLSTIAEGGTPSAQGEAAVQAAESQLGVPYVWGGETPGEGFDCSGLTQWSWRQAGVSIPRVATAQWQAITHVSLSDLEPGDLLFYYNLDGTGTVDHVAMYVGTGPDGSQTIIQAPYTGSTVSYDSLYTYGLIGAGQP